MDNSGATTAVSLGTTEIYKNNIHDLANTVGTASGIVYGIRANLTGKISDSSTCLNRNEELKTILLVSKTTNLSKVPNPSFTLQSENEYAFGSGVILEDNTSYERNTCGGV